MKPDRTKNYIFTFLLFIVIFAETIATSACCNIWSPSLRIDLQNAFLSSAALTAPYLILPPKWRRSLWIALPLLTLILLTDTIFFRISGHFYWLSQISISTIFSSLVVKSGTAALRWTDIFIPLPMLLLVFPYASWRRSMEFCGGNDYHPLFPFYTFRKKVPHLSLRQRRECNMARQFQPYIHAHPHSFV